MRFQTEKSVDGICKESVLTEGAVIVPEGAVIDLAAAESSLNQGETAAEPQTSSENAISTEITKPSETEDTATTATTTESAPPVADAPIS